MGNASDPCGGGDPFMSLGWGARLGMQPKSDYNTTFDNLAFYASPPSPPSCPADFSTKVQYQYPGYCKYKSPKTSDSIKLYLTKFGPAAVAVDATYCIIIIMIFFYS